jgi:uncharacterized protein (UPF0332 family)
LTQDRQELIQYRLTRASEALEETELLLSNDHLSAAVNRLYYACFYSVTALLLVEGHSSSRHSGVIALFDRHWIKPASFQGTWTFLQTSF